MRGLCEIQHLVVCRKNKTKKIKLKFHPNKQEVYFSHDLARNTIKSTWFIHKITKIRKNYKYKNAFLLYIQEVLKSTLLRVKKGVEKSKRNFSLISTSVRDQLFLFKIEISVWCNINPKHSCYFFKVCLVVQQQQTKKTLIFYYIPNHFFFNIKAIYSNKYKKSCFSCNLQCMFTLLCLFKNIYF